MNSMNNKINNLIEDINFRFELLNHEVPAKGQISFDFNDRDIHSVLSYLKSIGWVQLSLLTCVDWIEENKFQLVYILFNWKKPIRIQIRTKIDREAPKFRTITNIYPGAQYYERDVHEFFGVEFEGNEDSYKQLFLENWDDMPPLRKDFDSKVYSDKKYTPRKYNKNFNTKVGETI